MLPNESVERSRHCTETTSRIFRSFSSPGCLCFTAPGHTLALGIFAVYVLSRFVHFYVVLTARSHDERAVLWTIGSVAIYFMAAMVLWTALRH